MTHGETDALAIGVDEAPGRKLRLAKLRQQKRAGLLEDSGMPDGDLVTTQELTGASAEDTEPAGPSDWQRYFERACAYSDEGKYHLAVALLNRVVRRSDDNTEAFHRLGYAYGELRRHKLAIQCFNKVVQLSPGWSEGYSNRGWNHLRLNENAAAIEDLLRAVDINPNLATAWANLGQAYLNTGRMDKAISAFENATQCVELNESFCYELARCLERNGDRKESDRYYCRACEINPHFLRAWIKLIFRLKVTTCWPGRKPELHKLSPVLRHESARLPNMARIVKRENRVAADRAARTQERLESLWAFAQNPVSWILILILSALFYIALGN